MNNKIIAAGVVVALCAVALIGVGYAYTATVTSSDNAVGSDYITIQVGQNAEKVWTTEGKVKYNTETLSDKVVYTSIGGDNLSGTNGITVKKTSNITVENVTIVMSIPVSELTGGYQNLFYNSTTSTGANASLGGKSVTATLSDGKIQWSFSEMAFDTAHSLIITCLPGAVINGSLESGPSVDFPITFSVNYTSS